MAEDAPLGRFVEVASEVEPVGDLGRGGCPDPGALGEGRGAVAADDLDPRMFGRPGRHRARFTIRQVGPPVCGSRRRPARSRRRGPCASRTRRRQLRAGPRYPDGDGPTSRTPRKSRGHRAPARLAHHRDHLQPNTKIPDRVKPSGRGSHFRRRAGPAGGISGTEGSRVPCSGDEVDDPDRLALPSGGGVGGGSDGVVRALGGGRGRVAGVGLGPGGFGGEGEGCGQVEDGERGQGS